MSFKYLFFGVFAIVVMFFILDVIKNVRLYNKKRKEESETKKL